MRKLSVCRVLTGRLTVQSHSDLIRYISDFSDFDNLYHKKKKKTAARGMNPTKTWVSGARTWCTLVTFTVSLGSFGAFPSVGIFHSLIS